MVPFLNVWVRVIEFMMLYNLMGDLWLDLHSACNLVPLVPSTSTTA